MRSLAWLAVTLASLTFAQRISTSARCGPSFGFTCKGSTFGNCCSQYSYCGSTGAYCGAGCQSGYGDCRGSLSSTSRGSSTSSSRRVVSSPSPSPSLKVSSNARCGNLYNASPRGMTCLGSKYGNCCSQFSYCGSTDAYCGTGCQSAFGTCKGVSSVSSSSSQTIATSVRLSVISITSRSTQSTSSSVDVISSESSPSRLSTQPSSSQLTSSASASTGLPTMLGSSSFLISMSSSLSPSFTTSSSISSATFIVSSLTSTSTYAFESSSSSSSASDLTSSSTSVSASGSQPTVPSISSTVTSLSSSDSSLPAASSSTLPSLPSSSTLSLISSSTEERSPASSSSDVISSSISDSSLSSSISTSATSQAFDATISLSAVSSTSTFISTATSDASSSPSTVVSHFETLSQESSSQDARTTSSIEPSPTSTTSLAMSSAPSTSQEESTLAATTISLESHSSTSSSTISEVTCIPIPSSACKRVQDCSPSINAIVTPSAAYRQVPIITPVSSLTALPTSKLTVPMKELTVGTDYVLTFYSTQVCGTLGSGSNSCCNITAYMDDVAISSYCVGFYWSTSYKRNGPWVDSKFDYPRSPSVIYRPSTPNPELAFRVICPYPSNGVLVSGAMVSSISLVPRCTCQEQDKFQSIQSQPLNLAFNGNLADWDDQSENPIAGWTSQESWKDQVIPVQYKGTGLPDDTSNNGSVVLHGTSPSIYKQISNLDPSASYNVSLLWRDASWQYTVCNITVKFDDKIIMDIPRPFAYPITGPMSRNFAIISPQTTSGILWIGSSCVRDFIYNDKSSNTYPTMRIDDVVFTRVGATVAEGFCGSALLGGVSSGILSSTTSAIPMVTTSPPP